MDLSAAHFSQISFCFMYFKALLFGDYAFRRLLHALDSLIILSLCTILFVFLNFLYSEVILSGINTSTSAFSWLMVAWHISSHPLTFSLPKFYVWSEFLVDSIEVGYVFLIYSTSFFLLFGIFRLFIFKVTIDTLGLSLHFIIYFMFSPSVSHSLISCFLPSCDLLKH